MIEFLWRPVLPRGLRCWATCWSISICALRQIDIEGRVSVGERALDAYRKAVEVNPLDDTVTAKMGMTFDVMRRYPEAFFCYERAVTAQPYNGQFWYWLGNNYWACGMLEKA